MAASTCIAALLPVAASSQTKPKEKEIGSDRKTGGPTQSDRDAMDDIKRRAAAMREQAKKDRERTSSACTGR